jgi:type II secretion system protein C
MQFRLTQKHIIAFNFLLIAATAYYAALCVNDIILQRLQGAPVAPHATAARPSGSGLRARAYYDQIVKRDVFNLTPQETPPPVVTTIDLHLKLLGTSLATRQKPFAIIEDQNGEQSLYTLGDEIPNAGKLISVQKSRVIIQVGAQQVAVEIPSDDLPQGVEGPPGIPARAGIKRSLQMNPAQIPRATAKSESGDDDEPDIEVEEEGENRYALKRDDIRNALAHSSQLFSEIHAIPNIQNGKVNGFTLSEIEPGSVFEDLGLEDGDLLTAIDGKQLQNPAEAVGLLSTIQSRSALDITVMRDGRPVQLHYDIR